MKVKASGLQLLITLSLTFDRNKLYKTLGYRIRDMLNFDLLEKNLGVCSSPHFVHDFSRKLFLMLHSINSPKMIV